MNKDKVIHIESHLKKEKNEPVISCDDIFIKDVWNTPKKTDKEDLLAIVNKTPLHETELAQKEKVRAIQAKIKTNDYDFQDPDILKATGSALLNVDTIGLKIVD